MVKRAKITNLEDLEIIYKFLKKNKGLFFNKNEILLNINTLSYPNYLPLYLNTLIRLDLIEDKDSQYSNNLGGYKTIKVYSYKEK